MNSAEQLIMAAALTLEENDDLAGAEAHLRDAIELALVAGHPVELTRARALLGEILLNTGREAEAAAMFHDVLRLPPGVDASQVEEELETARNWLRELGEEGH